MTQRVGLLNGTNITYDKDLTAGLLAILNQGVIEGLSISGSGASANVLPGKALIECIRTNGEKVMVFFENTANVSVDLTGTKKLYIAVTQGKIDNGSSNALDGTGIGSIQTGASYPASNYIPLASITGGVITDARVFLNLKALLAKGYTTGYMKEIDPVTGNEVLRPLTLGSSILSTDLLSVIDPSTRARKEVPYGNISAGITKTAGETITVSSVPMAVSLDTTGNIIASNTSAYNRSNFYGFITTTVANGTTKSVITEPGSVVGGFTGLTPGASMYLSATNGVISSTIGALYTKVGYAISATEIYIEKEIEVARLTATQSTYPQTFYTGTYTPNHDWMAMILSAKGTVGTGTLSIQNNSYDISMQYTESSIQYTAKGPKVYGNPGAVVRARQYEPSNHVAVLTAIVCKLFS